MTNVPTSTSAATSASASTAASAQVIEVSSGSDDEGTLVNGPQEVIEISSGSEDDVVLLHEPPSSTRRPLQEARVRRLHGAQQQPGVNREDRRAQRPQQPNVVREDRLRRQPGGSHAQRLLDGSHNTHGLGAVGGEQRNAPTHMSDLFGIATAPGTHTNAPADGQYTAAVYSHHVPPSYVGPQASPAYAAPLHPGPPFAPIASHSPLRTLHPYTRGHRSRPSLRTWRTDPRYTLAGPGGIIAAGHEPAVLNRLSSVREDRKVVAGPSRVASVAAPTSHPVLLLPACPPTHQPHTHAATAMGPAIAVAADMVHETAPGSYTLDPGPAPTE
ncbi:hypothetical protein C8Q77DRAFT_1069961 [Trametes polyzona]|nr:hypothetical protein C8Q77DRAFT_1069961 [Trametes polyzona]